MHASFLENFNQVGLWLKDWEPNNVNVLGNTHRAMVHMPGGIDMWLVLINHLIYLYVEVLIDEHVCGYSMVSLISAINKYTIFVHCR